MQHTLIAVFDNRSDADRAMDDLLVSGFSREDVRLSDSDLSGSAGPHHEGIGASIKHFFSNIFGTGNPEHTQKYSEAVSRGHHVLTVIASDEPEVERAADIVERHGPVDIDEKHAEWAGGGPMARPESMRMGGAGGMQQSALLSQQYEGAVEKVVLGKNASQRQTDVQLEQPGAGSPSAQLDEDDYRRDWSGKYANSGGTYEDYAPAYSFGCAMARDGQYRGRPWNDVESDLRDTWERRYPGASDWKRFQAAIRYGWERTAS
jgi:hypothetical protein